MLFVKVTPHFGAGFGVVKIEKTFFMSLDYTTDGEV